MLRLYGAESPANRRRQRRHLHGAAAHQLLAGHRGRLAPGARVPARRGPRPFRRHRGPYRQRALRRRLARAHRVRIRRTRALLESGRPLTRALPWRLRLEVSGILAGGHRILDGIDAVGGDVFRRRPQLSGADWAGVARDAVFPPRRHRLAHPEARGMTPDEYCQQQTARSGTSFYYSFLFLPPERRRAITALYAFCREVDDVVDEVSDPASRARSSRGGGARSAPCSPASPQHPVALALQPVVADVPAARGALPDGDRRHGDGSRLQPLPRLRRARALLPLRGRRRRAAVGRNLRLRESGHAPVRARPRHRLPAHQHHPRRRRGCAPRPHLSPAGRTRASRRDGCLAAAAREQRRR